MPESDQFAHKYGMFPRIVIDYRKQKPTRSAIISNGKASKLCYVIKTMSGVKYLVSGSSADIENEFNRTIQKRDVRVYARIDKRDNALYMYGLGFTPEQVRKGVHRR